MKRLFIALVAAMLLCAFSVPASAKVVLKLGHIADPTHPYAMGAEKFAEIVAQKSQGDMEVRVFPSSQLGGQKDLVEGVILSSVDLALVGTGVLGQFQPSMSLFDLPFLFKSKQHAYASLDSVGMEIGKALESKGIKLLGYFENGIRDMTNNVRPIRTPADMKGLKIRVQNNKIYVEMIKALGASATPMAFGELYTAMQQGTVDGQENPSAHIWSSRFFEVQKYASLTDHAYAPEPMIMSMNAWGRLSAAQKDILVASAKEAIAWERKVSCDREQEYWDKIRATGKMEVIAVDREPFAEATKPVIEMFADEIGRDNIAKVRALAE